MFFGRKEQIEQLEALWRKRVSSLVTCRGRRRIGKSTLIEHFARESGSRFLKFEGRRPASGLTNVHELAEFAKQLAFQTGGERQSFRDWYDAFGRLDAVIEDGRKTVVLLDEISWLGHYDEAFADTLKICWDNLFKKHDRLILVLCGSVSSWIRAQIIDNSAYMGRRSLDLIVKELPLSECVKFWGKMATRIATKEILDVLSVTGGVPRYLEEIDPGLSADENIRKLAFSPNGILRTDFDEMFSDVITHQTNFAGMVLRALVDGGKSVKEIAATLKVVKGGNISAALDRLVEAGLVTKNAGRNPQTGAQVRECKYRLRDNYSRFFLKYVEPVKNTIDAGAFEFVAMAQFDGWESVLGLQFENLIVNNYAELLEPLHLSRTLVLSAAPYQRKAVPSKGVDGLQIDLLLQTKLSLCIVEIKHRRHVGREVIGEVEEKRRRLSKPNGVSVRTALVYDGELDMSVEADGYFDAIVPVRRLLGI